MEQLTARDLMRSTEYAFIEKVAVVPLLLARGLSLSRLFRVADDKQRHKRMDVYNLLFLLLVLLALLLAPTVPAVAAGVALYRWGDVTSYRLYFLLVKSRTEPWAHGTERRSIIIALMNFVEVIACFAILYLTMGDIKATTSVVTGTSGRVAAVYFSAVTMFTVGYGDFVPANSVSRIIVMIQFCSALIFFAFIIPALISLFSSNSGRK